MLVFVDAKSLAVNIEFFYDKEGSDNPISVFKFNIEKDSLAGAAFVDLPSALAVFCCGGSMNGPQSWSDVNGIKYDTKWWAGEDDSSNMHLEQPNDKQHTG